ncbi:hypothetical protein LZC95_51270 [Pendulispora brunnea]|uniref:Calcineurin-like phosphoesterase domain-containing protein n=1 Tax=Pendulispora brunnea TaxID=2905690 RepID=A0ABZ2KEK5_9BACT
MKRAFAIISGVVFFFCACGEDGSSIASLPDAAVPDAATVDVAIPDAGPAMCQVERPKSRFTVAVVPDTQYLFDQDRIYPEVLTASLRWIVDHAREYNIVFTAGLGDITENHLPSEFEAAAGVYKILDDGGMPYSSPAGNHDMTRSSQFDDARGKEPYLDYFSPTRPGNHPTLGGASPNGYNSYYIFDGGGQQWLLLALDWRMSRDSMRWAEKVIDEHPALPVIATMHEMVDRRGAAGDPPNESGVLSSYGQTVWDNLIKNHDQIFLTLNGHFWTPARTTLKNAAGHEVHLHLTNYQDRYYGGSGMIRLYEFDLEHGTIDVSTRSPYMEAIPAAQRLPAQEQEVELVDADNRFVETIDFGARFSGFRGPAAPPPPAPLSVEQVVVPGTVAYYRFENTAGGAVGDTIPDRSGRGNDLTRVTSSGGAAADITWTNEYHPAQPSRGALFFNGSKSKPPSYLRTVDSAPVNTMTFAGGYTIEAFVRPPADCCSDHAWMGVLSRFAPGSASGKTGDDPSEPLATLSFTDSPMLQWAIFPTNYDGIKTNWSHIFAADIWHHVAIVNDGHRTVMYVDGAPEVRNPRSETVGIAAADKPWLIGAYSYDSKVEQAYYGWLGDVRIVDHALTPAQFMTARP